MKIQILNDEDESTYLGGAAIANKRIADELINRGHDVVIHRVNKNENTWNGDMSADLYIVANWAFIPQDDLVKLFNERKVVKFFHDIAGFLYQPKTVKFKANYEFLQFMLDKSALNIFISPLQREMYGKYLNIDDSKCLITPPGKSMEGFENKGVERNNKILYLGDISNARGIIYSANLARQNGLQLDLIGPFVDDKLVEELRNNDFNVKREIDNGLVADLMNEYSYFIYFPEIIDSFCFKVVEAELCGCKLMVDDYRLGRYSYDKSVDELKLLIENSHSIVCDAIDNLDLSEDMMRF